MLEVKGFLDYVLEKGVLTSEDASKLIDLYKVKLTLSQSHAAPSLSAIQKPTFLASSPLLQGVIQ